MKKINSIIIVFVVTLLFSACGKEKIETQPEFDLSGPSYRVTFAGMNEEDSKAIFNSNNYARLVYENNDEIFVNGHVFRLHKDEDNVWRAYAQSSSGLTNDSLYGTSFSCFYVKTPANYPSVGSSTFYDLSFVGSGTPDPDLHNKNCYNSGIVLAGVTQDSIITLYPTFAIIRVDLGEWGDYYTVNQLSFGFDSDKVVKRADVTPTEGSFPSLSNVVYLEEVSHSTKPKPFGGGVAHIYKGEYLNANTADQNVPNSRYSYHLFVPLASNSVTTNMYIKVSLSDEDGTYVNYNKVENFTLMRGKVYTFNMFSE